MEKLNLPYEVWKSVKGYEGLYEVSNWGRVRSLPRMTPAGMRGGGILKTFDRGNMYMTVNLYKDGKGKTFSVHRLVADAFIPNPDNLPQVNHINEDKTDNRVENLEWCDSKYNINYGTHNERVSKTKGKTVYQFTLDGEFVREWISASEVYRQTGWYASSISACCRGKLTTAYNFKWSYTPLIFD